MIRRLRLITGLTLFFYLVWHTLPLVVGNYSLDAMEAMRPAWHRAWETWVGQAVLYAALCIHFALGLYAIYQRRRWRDIRFGEAVQLASGLAIPLLIALHLAATRIAMLAFGLQPNYPWIMAIYLKYDTLAGWRQVAVILIAWLHGCIGLYYWLRLKPIWPRIQTVLTGLAAVWPALALTGFYKAGSEAASRTADPAWVQMVLKDVGALDRSAQSMLYSLQDIVFMTVLVLAAASFLARWTRQLIAKRRGLVTLRYDNGTEYRFTQGLTLLEASRDCGYPHASVCGGRGRCSTCRVRVRHGGDVLPQAGPEEQRVLERIQAADDVRLACQAVPRAGQLDITPLLPHNAGVERGFARRSAIAQGRENEIAILFCDLRGFTQVSEDRLPYDTVFLLNRYFDAMGRAIEESGGHLDKFIGDGVMALFGLDDGVKAGCRNALVAAQRMAERLDALNTGLGADLTEPLRIGIGIHVGPAIVGEMGYGRAVQLTAIGDSVNTASRLESKSKDFAVQLVASRAVFDQAEITYRDRLSDTDGWQEIVTNIRGRTGSLQVVAIPDARSLNLT